MKLSCSIGSFKEHSSAIVQIQLERLRARLEGRKIDLEIDDDALTWLADAGYDQVYGVRPLKRVIQRSLGKSSASFILEDRLRDGETVAVSADNGELRSTGRRYSRTVNF